MKYKKKISNVFLMFITFIYTSQEYFINHPKHKLIDSKSKKVYGL